MSVTPFVRTRLPSLLCLCLVLLGASAPAAAQSRGEGTVYSRFGLGELRTFPSSQIEALGGRGTALRSLNYINFQNPASWSDQLLTRVAAGVHYETTRASTADSDDPSQLTAGALNAVQFGVPLLEQKLGVAFGFQPYSRVNYLARRENQIGTGFPTNDTIRYQINYEGRGGLQQIVGGLGYRINENLSVGANMHFIFGIIEDARRTSFLTSGYVQTNLTNATRLFGVTGTVGAIYGVTNLLGEDDALDIGVALTLPAKLSGEQVRTLGENLTRDTLVINGQQELSGSVTIPWSARLGLSYSPDARWLLLVDGVYEPWSNFEQTFPLSNERFLGSDAYSDRWRLSAGVEFLPAGNDLIASYLARTAYRLGAYVDQSYVSPVPDVKLQTAAVTAGISLPTLVSGTRIDLNMEIGTRGTTDQNLVRDVFYKVSANLNIGERWFRKRRLR